MGMRRTYQKKREYVVDRFSALSKRLKQSSSISVAFIKQNGLQPLSLLMRRFGPAAIGLLVTAAKEALREWLRQKGITILDDYF
jgi:hypothetical protein